ASDIFKISMGSGWASEADSIAALEASSTAFVASFAANNNEVADPGLDYNIAEGSASLNAKPTNDVSGATASNDSWYDAVTYKGAFDPAGDCTWLLGWTFIDSRGFLGCTTNVDEIAQNQFSTSVYPNPNNGQFTVLSESDLNQGEIRIYNGSGQLITAETGITIMKGQSLNISENLSPGIYFMILSDGSKVSNSTFIVK
ncbi:MAG: T9SS type A sorting domain-containing protein, partial [Flavobacteriales bacterium]